MNQPPPTANLSTVSGKQLIGRRKRPWSVTAVGLLLILQGIFLLSIFPVLSGVEIYNLPDARLAWLFSENGGLVPFWVEIVDLSQLNIILNFSTLQVPVPSRVTASMIFSALALPVFITGILILNLWRHAWTLAILFEGVILAGALFVYFNFNHPYVYLVMISGIFMVFYLNYYEVQLAFQRFGNLKSQ